MYLMRKLFVFASLLVLAMALAGSPAFGQIEASSEPEGEHCGSVNVSDHEAFGDCEMEVHNIIGSHLPFNGVMFSSGGSPISICDIEFEGFFNVNGSGLATHQQFNDVPGLGNSCIIAPCAEAFAGSEPWSMQWSEPTPGDERLTIVFCVTPFPGEHGGGMCEAVFQVIQADHDYLLQAEDQDCHGPNPAEVTGEFESELGPEIEHFSP